MQENARKEAERKAKEEAEAVKKDIGALKVVIANL